jgi:glycosyltransferase involved in cell wall biosynthesis
MQAAARLPEIKALVAAPQDFSDFLFAMDIFVYLSESEGLGSGILLAMAHGLPVIASRTGGIPEIVREGETGLLIANTEDELRAALHRLATDAPLRKALGAAGRNWVARHATNAIMAARTEAVYRKVLGSRR